MVKIQLAIFGVLTIIGLAVMGFGYIRVQTFLGIGTYSVKVDLPAAGGLYRFANVTYRGDQIGRVTDVGLSDDGVTATMSLDSDRKIPTDLRAEVKSVSAVGEQYVDIIPQTDDGPYLRDGSVIPVNRTTIPQEVGPLLDQLDRLVSTIPEDKFSTLLDETYRGFAGAGDDLGTILSSANAVATQLEANDSRLATLITDSGPLLDTQVNGAADIRRWITGLSGVTGTIASDDASVRTVLDQGPGLTQQATAQLAQLSPTLPLLLANLTNVGQVAVKYNPGLRQTFILLPRLLLNSAAADPRASSDLFGAARGDFNLQVNQPPACTVGFLPASQRRNPDELNTVDTPSDLYCKLAQDSPVAVRGARNYPCMDTPGRRAPTVALCKSKDGFAPLARNGPFVGGNPADPDLERQGVPDSSGGPQTGTPRNYGAPSSYDSSTGKFVAPDGEIYTDGNAAGDFRPATSWTQLMPQ
ncbi:MCE family protein [uncultured Williamsia sp.]|uniref:MCE family protein n=1 Tax=uncultured Williamsia sp. TaxID=259311 RepID=UPI002619B646|nr:MCE family protein [uncultured Williamsia sp.]